MALNHWRSQEMRPAETNPAWIPAVYKARGLRGRDVGLTESHVSVGHTLIKVRPPPPKCSSSERGLLAADLGEVAARKSLHSMENA